MDDNRQSTARGDALADALAICERISAQYQREAEAARARRERAVSHLLIKAGADQCAKAIRDMMVLANVH